jgi:hypothetical protein
MMKKEFGKEGSDGYVEDPMEIGSGIIRIGSRVEIKIYS